MTYASLLVSRGPGALTSSGRLVSECKYIGTAASHYGIARDATGEGRGVERGPGQRGPGICRRVWDQNSMVVGDKYSTVTVSCLSACGS